MLTAPIAADGEVSENNERKVKDPIIFGTAQSFENKAALVLSAKDFENPDSTVVSPDSAETKEQLITYEQLIPKIDEFLDSLSEEMGHTNQMRKDFFSDLEKAGKFAPFEEIIRLFSRLTKDDLTKLSTHLSSYASEIASKNRKKGFPVGYTTEKQIAINTFIWAGAHIWTSKEPISFSELLKKIL